MNNSNKIYVVVLVALFVHLHNSESNDDAYDFVMKRKKLSEDFYLVSLFAAK